jgi:hypothetical protein
MYMDSQNMEAKDFLNSDDIMSIIVEDLNTMGYVGEDRNEKLLYLGAVSRKLSSPLAFVLQATPSSGKSELLRLVTALQEPEEVYEVTRLTKQALFYLGQNDPNAIAHKWVTVAESPGAREANYAVRTLISEKQLRLTTVQNGAAIEIELRGPIAYCETTTQGILNQETASRMFNLRFDSSAEQTRKVQLSLARQAMGGGQDSRQKAIMERHHAAQRRLVNTEVIIPFAERIQFPFHSELGRREFKKFLDVIKASAFLHQFRRPSVVSGGVSHVVAQEVDYEIARELTANIIFHSLSALHPQAKLLLDIIDTLLSNSHKPVFTRGDLVRAQSELSLRQVRYWLDYLIEIKYIEALSGSKGKEYAYRLMPSAREHKISLA